MKASFALIPLALFLLGPIACDSGSSSADSAAGEGAAATDRGILIQDPIAEAKRLLAEAGYPDGKGFPEVEILYNTSEAHKKIAAAIQFMWKKRLGIKVELRNTEWKTYLDRLSKLDYQVARRGWIGDYNDPNTFLEMFTQHSGNNNTGWASKEFDELLARANAERDPEKRRELLERAEEILMAELPVIPIYFYVTQEMYREYVKGWYQNVQAIHPLKHAYRDDGKTLIINNHTEIQTLDPGIARGVPEHRIQIGLYEGLLSYDPKTTRPVPGVAEKWEISKDGKTYTFHLRDAKWSDGKAVTAYDFEYAWKRVLDPATASDYAHQLYYIKGAKEYNTGESGNPDTVAVTAKDDKTLVVELENPTPFFLDLMPFFTYYPVRKDVVEQHGNRWTLPEHHVGNGPFRLKEWVTNDYLLLEKNPNYWDAGNVKQQEIKFLPTQNVTTAFNLYDTQACDIITAVPLEFIEQLITRRDFHSTTYLGTYFYSFNVRKKPFDDRGVRKALALALDRRIIVEKITKGGQKPAYHYVPPVFPDFRHARFDER
ncbi:MAG: ABC transporter substrate-binding protein [Candidatus Methylomirabilia bacterium]